MTSREETAALEHLRRLLASDISKASVEDLADGVREAELLFDQAQQWTGRLVAELRRRGQGVPTSWAELSKLTGVPSTTLRFRVAKMEEGEGKS